MADFYIKQNDTEPPLTVTCVDENGSPVPLTAATGVKFNMINPGDAAPKVDLANAVIADALLGVVRYDWAAVDTDTPGDFDGEFEVTWSSGGKTTFPNFRYVKIQVVNDIA